MERRLREQASLRSGHFPFREVLAEGLKEDTYRLIVKEVSQFGRQREDHEDRIRELLEKLSAAEINNLRYRMFAPHYDHHMEGHRRSIDFLIHQLVAMERVAFLPEKEILRKRILEMSCGTGTVIKSLISALPHERVKDLRFVANDLSDEMKSIARDKLKDAACKVDFSGQDLTSLDFADSSFDSVILSQTLHLITDPDVVAQERSNDYMNIDNMRHLNQKRVVVESAFRLLSDEGTLILIDEWPALLSDRGGPLGPGFAYLFNDSLRGIDWSTFRDSVMSTIPEARFVAQLKVPIDQKHTMYLWVYRKDSRRIRGLPRLPSSSEFVDAREEACEKMISLFNVQDRDFIESAKNPEGGKPWVKFLPITRNRLILDGKCNLESGKFNSIIIRQQMHELPPEEKLMIIGNAIDALKLGGSLIIIDEWPEPKGMKHKLKKSVLRSKYLSRFSKHLVFAGSLRVPILDDYENSMYGYQYRRVL